MSDDEQSAEHARSVAGAGGSRKPRSKQRAVTTGRAGVVDDEDEPQQLVSVFTALRPCAARRSLVCLCSGLCLPWCCCCCCWHAWRCCGGSVPMRFVRSSYFLNYFRAGPPLFFLVVCRCLCAAFFLSLSAERTCFHLSSARARAPLCARIALSSGCALFCLKTISRAPKIQIKFKF